MMRIAVDPQLPAREAIGRAAHVILGGGVAAIPTDTLYGLAADPFNAAAVARIFTVKGRGADRALPLVAAGAPQVAEWLGELPAMALGLVERFWPGPLTLLVAAPGTLAAGVTGGLESVGVRVPAHAVTRALCAACERPLTATSANVSGGPATHDPAVVIRTLGDALDLVLDAGATPGGPPSTIVDVTGPQPRLVRPGAIAWDAVLACARQG